MRGSEQNTTEAGGATTRPNAVNSEISPKTLRRRGLLAAAWTAVVGLVLKHTTEPVAAGVDGDVVLGAMNTTTQTTSIANTTVLAFQDTHALDVFCMGGTRGVGVFSRASATGVWGFADVDTGTDPATTKTVGVLGESRESNGFGVWGECLGGVGVVGDGGHSIGMIGQSIGGYGILGIINGIGNVSTSANNTVAIYGVNNSRATGSSPGLGGFGVYGLSATGPGLLGATAAAGAAAVVGATNGVAGAYGGVFYGPVVVQGAFTVVGGPKSAAVPHPDGSHRRLYCMESPESWFEDFGKGRLGCGRAEIAIDPDFAAVTDLSDYHVFLTPRGEHQALTVVGQSPAGFIVEANLAVAALTGRKSSDLNGDFSWRVVARRKDVEGKRLEPVTIPAEPTLPPPPSVPTSMHGDRGGARVKSSASVSRL